MTLAEVLHPDSKLSPAKFVAETINQDTLPDYILDVRQHGRSIVAVNVLTQRGFQKSGFIHIVRSPSEYNNRRGKKGSPRAILLTFNQEEHHFRGKLIKICSDIRNFAPSKKDKSKRKKERRRNRINFFLNPEEE